MKVQNKALIYFFIIFCITFGASISFLGLSLGGISLTVFRVFMPILFVLVFCIVIGRYRGVVNTKLFLTMLFFMCAWMAYGICGMLFSPYSNENEAIREILSLFVALIIISMLYLITDSEEDVQILIKILKLVLFVIVVIAWIEMFTNWHLSTSLLVDTKANPMILFGVSIYPSTSIFYNMNDYCAFITMLLPVVYIKSDCKLSIFNLRLIKNSSLYSRFQAPKINLIDIFLIVSVVIQVVINDANICLIGIVVTYVVYKVKRQQRISKKVLIFCCIILALVFIDAFMASSVYPGNSFSQTLFEQSNRASLGAGSLYSRLIIYKDSLKSVFNTYGLGLGPAGFTQYFSINHSFSALVNPHNLWLEIFSEYGIFIFSGFVVLFVWGYRRMSKSYKKDQNKHALLVLCMMISYIFASLSPSSFLGFSYQWILWGMVVIVDKVNTLNRKNQTLAETKQSR